MARAKKPGAPGRTVIPEEVVRERIRVLKKAFKKVGPAEVADLVVVAQQHYLYLETVERPMETMLGPHPGSIRREQRPAPDTAWPHGLDR